MGKALSFPLPKEIVSTAAATVTVADLKARFSLRARGDLSALNKALGLDLPTKVGGVARAGALEAHCLGPDEWGLSSDAATAEAYGAKLSEIYGDTPHSLVDIRAREVTFDITGPGAHELMSIGCPRDLSAMPIGEARRTVFDGATVVIWRDAADHFRMDIWNSFAPFAAQTFVTGAKELAAEMA
jgi:sarcosine oxidase subunit gamma